MSNAFQIALTGKMRSGKDSVGEILTKYYDFQRFAFGDGIVKTAQKLFPEQFQGEKPRKLLQDFGQYCVGIDVDVWVNYLFREILFHDINPVVDSVVITDLRQPHEYKALKEAGFTIIRVNCPDEIRKQRIINAGETFSEERFNHITEQFVDSFEVDYEINNAGNLFDLHVQTRFILEELGGKSNVTC